MKQFFPFLVAIFLVLNVNSQNWVKHGSVWHYDESAMVYGFLKFVYEKDTIVLNQECQKIIQSEYNFYPQPGGYFVGGMLPNFQNFYTYSSGDSVFYLQGTVFKLLYNFGANIGDSWVISDDTIQGCEISKVNVINKGTIQISGKTLRFIDLKTPTYSKLHFSGRAVEGIGMIGNAPNSSGIGTTLFPREISCDSATHPCYYMYSFTCFDDYVSNFFYNPGNVDCEYLLNHVGISELSETMKVQVFPNPVKDILMVRNFDLSSFSNYNLQIFNLQGKLVKEIKIQPNQSQINIDIQSFNSGMYIGKIVSESGESASFKFVKE